MVASDLRVILVAEHASARFGGEAILPYQYFRRLRARGVDAWLVVHERTRAELNDAFGADQDRIVYVPDLWIHRALWAVGKRLPGRFNDFTTGWLMHLVTQWIQRREVRALVERVGADVVHEPIPVSPKTPSMMFDVGAPVIIGPMNGAMSYPPGFRHMESPIEQRFVRAGRVLSHAINRLIPGKPRAALLLVANQRTREALPRGCGGRVLELVENGVDLSLFEEPTAREGHRNDGPLRLIFLGRLVPLKGVDLLIDALAEARARTDAVLDIVGDGPSRPSLEAQARLRDLEGAVRFHGFVPHRECPRLLERADALVLPSLHECGGAVVLEAMAMGLPVVATDWGGPADYVDPSVGILVEPSSPEGVRAQLADAIVRLARSPEERRALGRAGRARAREVFDWERKVDRVLELYAETAAGPAPPAHP